MTADNFEFVTNAVAVCIIHAAAIAVQELLCKLTRSLVRGFWIVVARRFILTTHHLKLIANPVAIRVVQTVPIAIEVVLSVRTGAIFVVGFGIEVASGVVHAAAHGHEQREFALAIKID